MVINPFTNNNQPSLEEVDQFAWALLENGSRSPKEAFYTGTLGTITGRGIGLRTVVLREAFPGSRITICYSDKRAGKVEEIRQQDAVSWLFWDDQTKVQLRLNGRAAIHTDDGISARHWDRTTPGNRRSYMALPAPGSVQPFPGSGLPEGLDSREPAGEEIAAGRENFAVIVTRVDRLEWLWLGKGGHRRASFQYEGNRCTAACWLVP